MEDIIEISSSEGLGVLVTALTAGVLVLILSHKLRIVPIAMLLLAGFLLGKEGLNWVNPDELGNSLRIILEIGIAIILFEGALTLDYSEYKKASSIILKMLSLGVMVTWVVNALAIRILFSFPFLYCFFLSSLIVVTGPTVIMPILRRLNLDKRVARILHWEGILIDPIGVFLAVVCFEIIVSQSSGQALLLLIPLNLAKRLIVGIGIGFIIGMISSEVTNRHWLPPEMLNIFMLMTALLTFGVCQSYAGESGLLGVVVAGIVMGIRKKISLEQVKKFKLELTEMIVALIFILLSAGINFDNIKNFGIRGFFLLLVILFVTRPLAVFICSRRSGLTLKEKVFLSWLAPRGIIAATMASLFSLSLQGRIPQSLHDFIEIYTFAVIASTVVLQGSTVVLLAKFLGLNMKASKSWVIVGSHRFSQQIAQFLERHDKDVMLIDTNASNLEQAKKKHLKTHLGNSLDNELYLQEKFVNCRRLISLTDNLELNALVCQHWSAIIPQIGLHRWAYHSASLSSKPLSGRLIWSKLPKPSLVSVQIENKQISLKEGFFDSSKETSPDETLLMLLNNDGEILFEEFHAPAKNKKTPALFLVHHQLVLKNLMRPQLMFLGNKEHKPLFFKKLALNMALVYTDISSQDLEQSMLEQIKSNTIGIGNGVIIFRFTEKHFSNLQLGVASSSVGLALKTYDKIPVKLVFLIFMPKNDQRSYIKIIAEISKLVSDKQRCKRLYTTGNKTRFLENLSY